MFVCVCMVENQCMPQRFWQLSSQCFPVPKPNCPSSSSIGPPSVLYRPTHSACLLSRHHFGSQNKPTILLPDLFTHQACSGEHLSCCCSCLGCVWPVFQQKQQVAFSIPKRNLTISVVVEVCGWWFGRLPSALSVYSISLWHSSTHFLGLCLEQEDSCFHERDGRWRWKSWNNRLGILSLYLLKEYIWLLEVICVKLWHGADSFFFFVYNCL